MKKLVFLLPLLWSLLASPAWPAEIAHLFAQQNTNQTSASASYVDITGAALSSSCACPNSFVAGKQYLLFVTAQGSEDNTGLFGITALHGSTAFADSDSFIISRSSNTFRHTYAWFDVWTAVASEGIKLQHKVSAGNVNTDQISLFAINLTDDLGANDWKSAVRTNDDSLSTTPTDGASITLTPDTASDWLVCSYSRIDATDATTIVRSRIVRSGEASSTAPESIHEVFNTNNIQPMTMCRVFTLAAVSNTFKEQSEASASAHTRLDSKIFALNLNKFAVHANAYTEAETALSATNYATALQTASITPTVTGNVWMGVYWGFDQKSGLREAEFRLQVDDADQPAAQSTDNYQFATTSEADATTQTIPLTLSTMASLSNAAHTLDLDGSTEDIASASAGQDRTIWAVTMELAGAAGAAGSFRRRF